MLTDFVISTCNLNRSGGFTLGYRVSRFQESNQDYFDKHLNKDFTSKEDADIYLDSIKTNVAATVKPVPTIPDSIFVFNEAFDNAKSVRSQCDIQEMVKKAHELGRLWQIDVDWLDTNELSTEEKRNRVRNANRRRSRFEKRYGYKLE